jgi:hypothetical protein
MRIIRKLYEWLVMEFTAPDSPRRTPIIQRRLDKHAPRRP